MKNRYRIETNRIQYTDNKKERIKSGFITFVISGIILVFILLYKTTFTTVTPPTYIDITFETDDLGANYGTDEVGLGDGEPADQAVALGEGGNPLANSNSDNSSSSSQQEENQSFLSDPTSKENVSVPSKKTETKKKTTTQSATSTTKTTAKADSKAGVGNKNTGGNPQGNSAVGALLKGKGTSTTSTGEGTGGRPGQNQGVPDGGSGSGGEGIGNGRKLVSFIPGTMGRGGSVPAHDCTATGKITFSYTVDKNGNIVSVSRKSGTSNTCLVNTGIKWIKQYVKADKGTQSVSGSYVINFN